MTDVIIPNLIATMQEWFRSGGGFEFTEQADHGEVPPPDCADLYFLTDGKPYVQDDQGVKTELGAGNADLSQVENTLAMLGWDVDAGYSVYDDFASDSFDDTTGVDGSSTMVHDNTNKYYHPNSQTTSTLLTVTWEATANNPKSAFVALDIEPVDTITLGTDLKVFISMDGGTNYEEITGLTVFREVGVHDYVRGDVSDLTARDDATMKLKIEQYNSKNVRIHAIAWGVKY